MTAQTEDLAALRRTAMIYARGADRRSKEDWRSVLAEDVEISGPGFVASGIEACLQSIDFLTQSSKATRHLVHDQFVEVAGEHASGETLCTAQHRIANAEGADTLMCWAIRYQDEWRWNGADWRFTRRHLIVDWEENRPVTDPNL